MSLLSAPRRTRSADDDLFDEEFLRKLEVLHVVSRKVLVGRTRAERRTKKKGSGIEFADHRSYVSGDDLRYIDWNVYGRMDRLLLRLFEEEEDLSIYLLFDASRSMAMGTPPKLDYARRLVAALGYIGLANLDRISVVPFSSELHERLPMTRGKGRVFQLLDFLRGVGGGGETRLGPSMKQFVHQSRRPGLVVVVSDFYDPAGYTEALNLLRYHKHDPFVIQVYDRKEADPPLHGDLLLLDCETGDPREVTVSPGLLAEYRRQFDAYCTELQEYCTRRAVPFFRTHTELPFDELVLRIFRAGGFVK